MALNPVDPFLNFLQSISGRQVHFFPKSGNAGDGFIAHATFLLFEQFKIDAVPHPQTDTVTDGLVLIGGGGNMIEGRYHDIADLISKHIDVSSEVVVLPQTVMGFRDRMALTHRNLRVFCRDKTSFDLALAGGANPERTLLSNDVTFYMDHKHFGDVQNPGRGTLYALREDGESSGAIPRPLENIDISLSWNGDIWTCPRFCRYSTLAMAAFIAQFETVVTDRLHVSIMAALLGRSTFLLPNSYFKNRAVFEHSMKERFPNVRFVNILPTAEDDGESSGPELPSREEHDEASAAYAKQLEEQPEKKAELLSQLEEFSATQEKRSGRINELEQRVAYLNHLEDRVASFDRRVETETSRREVAERSLQLLREKNVELRQQLEDIEAAAILRQAEDLANLIAPPVSGVHSRSGPRWAKRFLSRSKK